MSTAQNHDPAHPSPHPAGTGCRRPGRLRHGARRSSWQVAGIAATIAAGVAVTSGGVYAALTAQAFNGTAQQVSTGTLLLTLNNTAGSAGFASVVDKLAPGDVVNRYVQLQNTGTLAGQGLTLGVSDSTPSLLTTDATRGLQVSVNECPVAWTTATGTCTSAGTATTGVPVLVQTPAATLANPSLTPAALTGSSLAANAVRYYQVSMTLPTATNNEITTNGVAPAAGTTIQGLTATLTWKFVLTQRTATTTNT